jgi:hypothetical protein
MKVVRNEKTLSNNARAAMGERVADINIGSNLVFT